MRLTRCLLYATACSSAQCPQCLALYQALYSRCAPSASEHARQFSLEGKSAPNGALAMSTDILLGTVWGMLLAPNGWRQRMMLNILQQDKGSSVQTSPVLWLGNPDAREALFSPFHNRGNWSSAQLRGLSKVTRLLLVRPEVHSHIHLTPGVLWILSSRLINSLPRKTSTSL